MGKETEEERRARKEREAKEKAAEKKKSETTAERDERKRREKDGGKESKESKDTGKSKGKEKERDRDRDRDKDDKKKDREKDRDGEKSKERSKAKDRKRDDDDEDEPSLAARAARVAMEDENARAKERKDRKEKGDKKETSSKEKKEDPEAAAGDDRKGRSKDRKSRREEEKPQNKLVVDAEKAARQAVWDASMARGQALLRVLELDMVTLECAGSDIQPLTEYELFITAYGGSDRTQASTQMPGEDELTHRPVQTGFDVTYHDRGFTMPDDFGVFVRPRHNQALDHEALSAFLAKYYPCMHSLLDEAVAHSSALVGTKKTKLEFSVGYSSLTLSTIIGARPLVDVSFSRLNPQYLLAVYGPAPQSGTMGSTTPETREEVDVPFTDGIVAVYNVNSPSWPDKFLVAPCGVTTAIFSPTRPHVVYGGGADGQLMAWDLREPDHIHTTGLRSSHGAQRESAAAAAGHRKKKKKDKEGDEKERKNHDKGFTVLRYPTYTTQWSPELAHPYPISRLAVSTQNAGYVKKRKEEELDEESESIAVLDSGGILSFWVLQDLQGGEHAVAERDYGLAPFARIKLLRSSVLEVQNPDRETEASAAQRTTAVDASGSVYQQPVDVLPAEYVRKVGTGALDFVPRDPSRYLIGTDAGFILHANRYNAMVQPPLYYSVQPNQCLNLRERAAQMALPRDLKYGTTCQSLAFCPAEPDYFIAGFSDGSVSLYRDGDLQPLFTFSAFTHRALLKVAWSRTWKGVFFALSDEGTLYTFDLMNDDIPRRLDTLFASELLRKDKERAAKDKDDDALDFPVTFDVSHDVKGESRVAVAYRSGLVAVHVLKDSLFSEQRRDQDFFATLDD